MDLGVISLYVDIEALVSMKKQDLVNLDIYEVCGR